MKYSIVSYSILYYLLGAAAAGSMGPQARSEPAQAAPRVGPSNNSQGHNNNNNYYYNNDNANDNISIYIYIYN